LFALSGYSERDRWETEANAFAAELLAPAHQIRAVLESGEEWTVSGLCATFGVSRTLIHTQLAASLATPSQQAYPTPNTQNPTPTPLDPDQERAASVATPALIVAGPGAGKTRVLVERFARLVKGGADPKRILALTYANKAAGEMRERLAALLEDDERQGAMEVSTFHALGWQLLREFGQHLGYKMPLRLVTPSDALLLMRPEIARLPLDGFTDLRRPLYKVREFLTMVSRCKDEDCAPEQFADLAGRWQNSLGADATEAEREAAKRASDGAVFYAVYQALLRANNYLDYGDLITQSLRLFAVPEVAGFIRSRYDHILVDEFQDINYASGQLLQKLDAGRGIVWAVGDPKQSIYGFRGASPVNIARFAEDYPGATVVPLSINYRSLQDIVRAGQAVDVPSVPTLPLSAYRGGSDAPAVRLVEAATMRSEAVFVADEIEKLTADGVAPGEIAILCRSKTCIEPIAEHLSHRRIAHTWGGDLEDSPVFKILMAVLYLATDDVRGIGPLTRLAESRLTEPERRALLAAAPRYADDTGKPSAARLLRAATDGRIEGVTGRAMLCLARLVRIAEGMDATKRPFTNLCRYLFEEAVWFRTLFTDASRSEFAVRKTLAAIRQTLSFAARFAERQSLIRASTDDTASFLRFVEGAVEAGGLAISLEVPRGDSGAVNLLTAHGAKGLQWPVVFVPGLSKDRFPARFQGWRDFVLPPGMVHTTGESEPDTAAHVREEACLFYVAATRAQNRLYLSRARKYPATWQKGAANLLIAVRDALNTHDRLAEWTENDAEGESNGGRFAPLLPDESAVPTVLPDPVTEYALTLYAGCPRRYLYQFVYGMREYGSAFLAFRDSLKRAQRQVLARSQSGGGIDSGDAEFALAEIWKKHGPSPEHWYEPFFARVAREALVSFALRVAGGTETRLAVGESVTLSLPATDAYPSLRQVRVTIDECETRTGPGGVRKTFLRRNSFGKPKDKPDTENKDVLYALHGEAISDGDVTLHRSYPRYRQELPIPVTATVRKNRVGKLHEQLEMMEQGRFPSRPNDQQCPTCPYALICPGTTEENPF
jgi:DNA helicase-2/ATP-dependent DNA helicase PcrA